MSLIPNDDFASAEDREYIRGQYGYGPPIIYEIVNCKWGCQISGSPSWMQEHYKECPSRLQWEEYYRKQAEERQRRENEKLGLRPIIHDYGHFTNEPVTGISRPDSDIKAEAAESYKKELAASSQQQPESEQEESDGGGESK